MPVLSLYWMENAANERWKITSTPRLKRIAWVMKLLEEHNPASDEELLDIIMGELGVHPNTARSYLKVAKYRLLKKKAAETSYF